MKDEVIKVGDVCEIVGTDCACPLCLALIGLECTVVGPEEAIHRIRRCFILPIVESLTAFRVTVKGNPHVLAIERQYLRKRPPKAEPVQTVRQETMPRADFDRWLDGVRQGEREEQPA